MRGREGVGQGRRGAGRAWGREGLECVWAVGCVATRKVFVFAMPPFWFRHEIAATAVEVAGFRVLHSMQ